MTKEELELFKRGTAQHSPERFERLGYKIVQHLEMTEQKLQEALSFIKVCWENIQYQHEINIDIETDFKLLASIAKREGWK